MYYKDSEQDPYLKGEVWRMFFARLADVSSRMPSWMSWRTLLSSPLTCSCSRSPTMTSTITWTAVCAAPPADLLLTLPQTSTKRTKTTYTCTTTLFCQTRHCPLHGRTSTAEPLRLGATSPQSAISALALKCARRCLFAWSYVLLQL
jgi:hypothetical protein